MRVLLTGAFGNVGLSTLRELLLRNREVTVFEVRNKRNIRLQKKYRKWIKVIWGDIRNRQDVASAVAGQDAVIHLAAVIPPLADRKPGLARSVNVDGTGHLVRAMEALSRKPKLLFSSSVAVYGDRLKEPYIRLQDALTPNEFDGYAQHKVEAEGIIRASSIDWAILRLSFIVPPASFRIDPILFEMPLSTAIEPCDTREVGVAFANALERDDIWGETFHIAGGEKYRTTYGEYINRIMECFGVGRDRLPVEAFAKRGYHCGFMETVSSQDKLRYQGDNLGLEDHYRKIWKRFRLVRFFGRFFRFIAVAWIVSRSPYYREWKRTHKTLSAGLGGAKAF